MSDVRIPCVQCTILQTNDGINQSLIFTSDHVDQNDVFICCGGRAFFSFALNELQIPGLLCGVFKLSSVCHEAN